MHIAAIIVAVLLALSMLASALGKLTKMEPVVETMDRVGVPRQLHPYLAGAQIAGAVGLLVGIAVPAIGVAAGVGLALYFVGACGFHVRAGDAKNAGVPAFLAIVSVVSVVLTAAAA